MKAFVLIFSLSINILASNCDELTSKIINTYVISDSTVLMKNNLDFIPSVEVGYSAWTTITNSHWIWFTSNFKDKTKTVIEFSKVFNIPGRIISGKIEYLVDNLMNNLSLNGISGNVSSLYNNHKNISTYYIKDLLTSGINYINLTVENKTPTTVTTFPGGVCFLITASSEVFI